LIVVETFMHHTVRDGKDVVLSKIKIKIKINRKAHAGPAVTGRYTVFPPRHAAVVGALEDVAEPESPVRRTPCSMQPHPS
jgi:hypothetical protein